jgi:hypothetical protein
VTISFGSAYPDLTLTVNFSGSTWTDISAYVRSCDTNRPSSDETGRYSPGTATIVLDNRDGRFTPANLSGPYVSGGVSQVLPEIGMRLVASWSGTDYSVFSGIVEDWQDEFPEFGYDAVTVLTVVDYSALIAEWNGSAVAEVGDNETSNARYNRILDAAGFSVTQRIAYNGDSYMQATTLEGNGLDQLHEVVDAEGGAIWYDPGIPGLGDDGYMVFIGRSTRVLESRYKTSQTTFSAAAVGFRDPVVTSGRERIVRSAAFAREGGVEQVAGSGTPRHRRTGLPVTDDPSVLALAQLAVAVGDPADNYRVKGVSCDPVNGQTWASVLDLGMQDRCTVTIAPPVSGVSISRQVFVDGIAHHIRPMQWSIDFTFQSAEAWDAFDAAVWDTGVWDTAVWFY